MTDGSSRTTGRSTKFLWKFKFTSQKYIAQLLFQPHNHWRRRRISMLSVCHHLPTSALASTVSLLQCHHKHQIKWCLKPCMSHHPVKLLGIKFLFTSLPTRQLCQSPILAEHSIHTPKLEDWPEGMMSLPLLPIPPMPNTRPKRITRPPLCYDPRVWELS